jgi:hypothetical protein
MIYTALICMGGVIRSDGALACTPDPDWPIRGRLLLISDVFGLIDWRGFEVRPRNVGPGDLRKGLAFGSLFYSAREITYSSKIEYQGEGKFLFGEISALN